MPLSDGEFPGGLFVARFLSFVLMTKTALIRTRGFPWIQRAMMILLRGICAWQHAGKLPAPEGI
jgi:hypothetical protein